MPSWSDPRPSAQTWHAVGLAAFLSMLALYGVAGGFSGDTHSEARLFWVLGIAATLAATAALIGRWQGWQHRRGLLIVWPIASLMATTAAGLVDPDATRTLPGTITITFAFVGLTGPRWRSPALVPLGIAAFVVGGSLNLLDDLPTVAVTAVMWVLVAEVPAWLVTRLQEQGELLRTIAETDSLTALLNRSTLSARLSEHADGSAVVLIDLDSFKRYNDTHGHEAGDRLLVDFADALRRSVRQRDMIFRIGGDEFLLILVGADQAEAEDVIACVRRRWSRSGTGVGFSAGVAMGEQDLMRAADERMYAAKRFSASTEDRGSGSEEP